MVRRKREGTFSRLPWHKVPLVLFNGPNPTMSVACLSCHLDLWWAVQLGYEQKNPFIIS